MNYADHVNEKKTPQSEPIPGSQQVRNSAGGYSFAVDDWVRLDRFLILGTEGGSYYATERKLTIENANVVRRCIALDGLRVVNRIVAISDSGRAPKNDPAILALAMCAKKGDDTTRRAALRALPEVCRIGTHLHRFAEYIQAFGGWGRGTRRAVARWYTDRDARSLAHQVVKYQSRDGWSNRDLLRLSHPIAPTKEHAAIFNWITKWEGPGEQWSKDSAVELVWAYEKAKRATSTDEIVKLIREYYLPRECVPTEHLNNPKVWAALLTDMKPEAMIRNLGKMTAVGLLQPMSDAANLVVSKLSDRDALVKARLHPIKVLAALLTYRSGHGVRGSLSWSPVAQIIDALDAAFYLAFASIEPTNKRTLLALDVSGSMGQVEISGVPGLTPRVGSAAMALVTAATEKVHNFVAFTDSGSRPSMHHGYRSGLMPLAISPRQRIDDVVRQITGLPFGGTDCALPMIWAKECKLLVDTFVIYTDSETWHGNIHPIQALHEYRQASGQPAKLVVVGMVSNGFTIADPNDTGMMDVVGFDTAAPQLMADFAR